MDSGAPLFDPAHNPQLAGPRLEDRIKAVMLDGNWRSLRALGARVGERYSHTNIGARVRDLRKIGHIIETRRNRATGRYEYRLVR